jgi:hypothetical protein
MWSAAYKVGVVEAGPEQPRVWRPRARLYLLADLHRNGSEWSAADSSASRASPRDGAVAGGPRVPVLEAGCRGRFLATLWFGAVLVMS